MVTGSYKSKTRAASITLGIFVSFVGLPLLALSGHAAALGVTVPPAVTAETQVETTTTTTTAPVAVTVNSTVYVAVVANETPAPSSGVVPTVQGSESVPFTQVQYAIDPTAPTEVGLWVYSAQPAPGQEQVTVSVPNSVETSVEVVVVSGTSGTDSGGAPELVATASVTVTDLITPPHVNDLLLAFDGLAKDDVTTAVTTVGAPAGTLVEQESAPAGAPQESLSIVSEPDTSNGQTAVDESLGAPSSYISFALAAAPAGVTPSTGATAPFWESVILTVLLFGFLIASVVCLVILGRFYLGLTLFAGAALVLLYATLVGVPLP